MAPAVRLNGQALIDEIDRLFAQALDVLGDYEPRALIVDYYTWRDLTTHRGYRWSPEGDTFKGLKIEMKAVREPTPLMVNGYDTVPFAQTVDNPQLLSIESTHRFSERPRFFNWDGNPEGYK